MQVQPLSAHEDDSHTRLRQLVAHILNVKVDHNVASLIARFLSSRCMICDEEPGVLTAWIALLDYSPWQRHRGNVAPSPRRGNVTLKVHL